MILLDRMNQALDDYFTVTKELKSDVEMFLDVNESGLIKDSDIRWKRNFIRTLVAVIEGHSYMRFVKLQQLNMNVNLRSFRKRSNKVITSGDDSNIRERIKYTLSGSYKIFNFPPPDFGTADWESAQEGLNWRNDLTHPKTPADLEIASDSWTRIDSGLIWLLKQHFDFLQHLHEWNTKSST